VRQTCLDVIQLFDLDLSKGSQIPDMREYFEQNQSETFSRFVESYLWLFDPQEERSLENDPTLHVLSSLVSCPYSLSSFDRFSLQANPGVDVDKGGVLTISRYFRVATICIWQRHQPPFDALKIKGSLTTDIPKHYRLQLSKLNPYIAEAELMFPFIGLKYEAGSLADILKQEGPTLGKLFSGGLDHETEETLAGYLLDNLSIRKYEGLFVRSSEALGVYTSGVENSEDEDLLLSTNTLFRAVQACEVGLLAHRLTRSYRSRTDDDAKKVRILPRPFLIEKRRVELSRIEMEIIKGLPFRSPEAHPLVRKVQQKFNIAESLGDAKDSYSFLEGRYQNSKATALAIIAILTYISDKMHLWDYLSPFHPYK
jgi:hypothetical protein